MKLAQLGTALVALTTMAGFMPAWAQHHAFHPVATPATCVSGCADASAVWVADHNHFHPVLDLHTDVCGLVASGVKANIANGDDLAIAGAKVHGLAGFEIGNFAFDYKTDYCSGEMSNEEHFVFVSVTNAADNELFFAECSEFPNGGALNTWHHERFTNQIMDFPHGDQFGIIFIGIYNEEFREIGSAQVTNITVDDVATDDALVKSVTFCPEVDQMD